MENPSLRGAGRALERACKAADAAAAREALLAWGNALLAPRVLKNLHELRAVFGAELASQIELLNTALYSKSDREWRGDDLIRLCRRLEDEHRVEPSDNEERLAPLNPSP